MSAALLRADGIHKQYGGIAALADAGFELQPGEVHALMGENGAGKSTLAKILAGAAQADSGTILVDGERAAIHSPADAQRYGIGIVPQELDLFPHLTVGENMVAGNQRFRERWLTRVKAMDAFCRPFLEQAGLRCDTRAPAGTLSTGQMQMLAIARALSMEARIILMDEPTSSLFGDAVERLFASIEGLKRRGVAVVYVSHKLDEIFRICDRVTVLRDGKLVGTRAVADTSRGELIGMMVGRELAMTERHERRPAREVLLKVQGLTTKKLHGISFELRRGEVLGVAGLVGAGRSELGAALFGLDAVMAGTVELNGRAVRARSAREAMQRGLGLLPEDRKLQGLMMQMSVLENSTIAVLGRLARAGFLRKNAETEAAEPLFRDLALKAPSRDACVSTLSGGNQQKVLFAKCLLAGPDVVFLDDPARGVDIGAKQDIYRIIQDLTEQGKGVILVSSELPELLHCSDRILVMREGRATALYDAAEATQERIMASAALADEAA